jgi:electron transport complex protein RnfB
MIGIVILTVTAFCLGLILAVTNYYLNREDKRISEVRKLLPGYNCGSCGFGGCDDMAMHVVSKGVDPKRCKPMREEQYKKIREYLKENKIKIKS